MVTESRAEYLASVKAMVDHIIIIYTNFNDYPFSKKARSKKISVNIINKIHLLIFVRKSTKNSC